MGCPSVDTEQLKGVYVEPCEWNKLIDAPDIIVIGMIVILIHL